MYQQKKFCKICFTVNGRTKFYGQYPFCVNPAVSATNTTNGERNFADEAAAKEREVCAKRSFVKCS